MLGSPRRGPPAGGLALRSEDLSSGTLGMGGSRVLACTLMCSCCVRLARVCCCAIGPVCPRPLSLPGSSSDFLVYDGGTTGGALGGLG